MELKPGYSSFSISGNLTFNRTIMELKLVSEAEEKTTAFALLIVPLWN